MIRRIWSALQDAWYSPNLALFTAFAVAIMVVIAVVAS